MSGLSNRVSLLRRRGLAYPGGFAPGFDPSHILSKGISPNSGFSGISVGANFVSLLNGTFGTTSGVVTGAILSGIGPSSFYVFSGATNCTQFTGQKANAPSAVTIGCVFQLNSTNGFTVIFVSSTASFTGATLYNSSGNLVIEFSGTGSFTFNNISLAANVPYFAVASLSSGSANLLLRRLDNGKILTQTGAGVGAGSADNGTYQIGNHTAFSQPLNGYIAAVAYNPLQALSLSQMQLLAADPWSFWYPTSQGSLAFDPAFIKASGGSSSFSISPVSGAYLFTGTTTSFNRGIHTTLSGSTYTFTGSSAGLGDTLPIGSGTYTYSGTSVVFNRGIHLPLTGSSYAFNGTTLTLSKSGGQVITITPGTYLFSGTSATLGIGMPLSGSSYSYTGSSMTFGRGLITTSGSYLFSGTSVTFPIKLSIKPTSGTYSYVGSSEQLVYVPGGQITVGGRQIWSEELDDLTLATHKWHQRLIDAAKPGTTGEDIRAIASKLGKLGGHARAESMTQKQRTQQASKAALTRWRPK